MTKLREQANRATENEFRPVAKKPGPLRPHVLGAVLRRDFVGYFSNPAGYVFICLFVLVCSWAQFWQPAFFANNLVNLAPLNEWMPYILLFFIPAITMSTWAEERKQGTEELLLTLPARDVEVVLGKYFAALGILTVAIVFLALGHVPILGYLGQPDLGVLAASYLGYWLMGGMLIAFGMVASILSANATVAFILGAVFGAVPVFARLAAAPLSAPARRFVGGLSAADQFRDFGAGVVPLSGVVYFVGLAAGMLYLNMVLLGRRHWAGGEESQGRWGHAAARVAAVVVALVCAEVIVQKALGSWRVDLTEGRVHTLSPSSRSMVRSIPRDRPVFIKAFVSPEVPREYVQTRLDLIDTLTEFAALGGDKIRLEILPVEKTYGPTARDAEKSYGITARSVPTVDDGRQAIREIFLGVAFSSGLEQVVVPFFDRGLPVEYEVARSIRVVSGSKRKKVGILDTDARLLGGVDFAARTPATEWEVVTELKKQYEVSPVSADGPIPTDLDALVVAQPSSLAQRQIDNLGRYVRGGGPTLLLLDPVPVADASIAPREPRQPPGGMFGGGAPPEPKGNLRPLLNAIGLVWVDDEIVWSPYDPHPKYKDVLPEFAVFVGRGATPDAFGPDPVSRNLQEVLLLYAGHLDPLAGASTKFEPLLVTDDMGGVATYDELRASRAFGNRRGRDAARVPSLRPHVLAARVSGPLPAEMPPPSLDDPHAAIPRPVAGKANVIAVADLDLISDELFAIRRKPVEALDELDFDNVSFILNCVDSLARDESFLTLRSRRGRHRTLQAVEDQAKQYVKRAEDESKAADADAKQEVAAAEKRFADQVEKILASKDIDELTKESAVNYRRDIESKRLNVAKAQIEDRRIRRDDDAKAEREQGISRIQNGIRVWALILPPLPALLLAGFVFFARARDENRGSAPNRMA